MYVFVFTIKTKYNWNICVYTVVQRWRRENKNNKTSDSHERYWMMIIMIYRKCMCIFIRDCDYLAAEKTRSKPTQLQWNEFVAIHWIFHGRKTTLDSTIRWKIQLNWLHHWIRFHLCFLSAHHEISSSTWLSHLMQNWNISMSGEKIPGKLLEYFRLKRRLSSFDSSNQTIKKSSND